MRVEFVKNNETVLVLNEVQELFIAESFMDVTCKEFEPDEGFYDLVIRVPYSDFDGYRTVE